MPRRRGALVQLQHLLHPGPRRRRGRRRSRRAAPRAPRGARVRVEGRDARGVLVVHRTGPALARRRDRRGSARAEHDPRRRRRRHPARAQGQRVRARGRRPGPRQQRLRGVRDRARAAGPLAGRGPAALDADRRGHHGRHRGDHHRRAPALPDGRPRGTAVPGDQRQRLGHQVQVRQPLRLPPLADRRDQPRHRRDDRRQGGRRVRLRRRRQGLRRSPCAARAPA